MKYFKYDHLPLPLPCQVAEPNPAAPKGMCYVETKSLDGETNLKVRSVLPPLIGKVSCAVRSLLPASLS